MVPARGISWNVEFGEILYLLAAVVIDILVYAIYRRSRVWRLGHPANRFNRLGKRMWDFIVITVIDGIIHRFVAWHLFAGTLGRLAYGNMPDYAIF